MPPSPPTAASSPSRPLASNLVPGRHQRHRRRLRARPADRDDRARQRDSRGRAGQRAQRLWVRWPPSAPTAASSPSPRTPRNLVAGDTNGTDDVFVHDRQTGDDRARQRRQRRRPERTASATAPRSPPTAASSRSVAAPPTSSRATRTVPTTSSSTTARPGRPSASASTPAARRGNDASYVPRDLAPTAASWPSSRRHATSSRATRTAGDDVFVHDRQSGTTERVSVDSGGAQANDSDLPSDQRRRPLRRLRLGRLQPRGGRHATASPTSSCATGRAARPSASASPRAGRRRTVQLEPGDLRRRPLRGVLVFATNLVAGDDLPEDVFVHDRQAGRR